jgi:hypothetical protein
MDSDTTVIFKILIGRGGLRELEQRSEIITAMTEKYLGGKMEVTMTCYSSHYSRRFLPCYNKTRNLEHQNKHQKMTRDHQVHNQHHLKINMIIY